MLVSRKSGSVIQIRPLPCWLANPERELFEAFFQRAALPAPAPGGCVLIGEVFKILTNQTCQRCVPLDRDFSDLAHQLGVERKGNVHVYRIRESRNMCNQS